MEEEEEYDVFPWEDEENDPLSRSEQLLALKLGAKIVEVIANHDKPTPVNSFKAPPLPKRQPACAACASVVQHPHRLSAWLYHIGNRVNPFSRLLLFSYDPGHNRSLQFCLDFFPPLNTECDG